MMNKTMPPRIAALCPTYKRPDLLSNALACWESQEYPNASLLILDDADQHNASSGGRWRMVTQAWRWPSLTAKLNAMAEMALAESEVDILVVWEDDDIYFPHHLTQIAAAWAGPKSVQYFAPETVLSTYAQPFGGTQSEGARGRFHAAWGYTRPLWQALGGYPQTTRLDFDQQMGQAARQAAGGAVDYCSESPTYVYRWGNGIYHGSQAGEDGYEKLWDRLAHYPAPMIGDVSPCMDEETQLIFRNQGHAVKCGECAVALEPWENLVCEGCGA